MQAATIEARMGNPAMVVPDALQPLLDLGKAAGKAGLPPQTAGLVHLRAAQINGCSWCTHQHSRDLKKAGATDDLIYSVAAWREAPYFTEAERAALALTEAATRLSDRPNPVPDEVFEEAARHYDEQALAALAVEIALINFWNRLNVIVGQPAGAYPG